MKYEYYNPNPTGRNVGDCTVRALSIALEQSWDETYINLCVFGLMYGDMPSANAVWGAYLKSRGYERNIIPDICPDCYTVEDFADEHVRGTFILALSGHVVCVQDGTLFDSWNSKDEVPLYFWHKE